MPGIIIRLRQARFVAHVIGWGVVGEGEKALVEHIVSTPFLSLCPSFCSEKAGRNANLSGLSRFPSYSTVCFVVGRGGSWEQTHSENNGRRDLLHAEHEAS